jgi:histidyl-tRNA synthetase
MAEQDVTLPEPPPLVAVIGVSDDLETRLRIATALRDAGLRVRPDGSTRKLGKQLESAAKAGARWAVIGGEELSRGQVVLRDLSAGEQRTLPLTDVASVLQRAD